MQVVNVMTVWVGVANMPLELAYLQTFRIIINAISGIEILDTLDGYIIKMSMVQKKV